MSPDINVYTCTIGKRATQAKYYVPDPSCVVEILEQMRSWSRNLKKVHRKSSVNLCKGLRSGALLGDKLSATRTLNARKDKDVGKLANAAKLLTKMKPGQLGDVALDALYDDEVDDTKEVGPPAAKFGANRKLDRMSKIRSLFM